MYQLSSHWMNFYEILYGEICRGSSRLGKIIQKYQTFRRVRKVAKSAYDLRHVQPHVSERLPLDGLPWNLILGTFMEVSREKLNLVKIQKKYRTRFIVSGDINHHKSDKSDKLQAFKVAEEV